MFPRNFPVDREVVFANLLRTCCGLVSNTANKSATSWQQVIVMEFGKRHDTTQHTQRTFALASLLQTSYGLAIRETSLQKKIYALTWIIGVSHSSSISIGRILSPMSQGTTAPVRYYPSTALVLSFFGHLCRADTGQDHSRAIRACIRGPPKDWRRTGRLRQTSLRTVEDDLRPLNFGLATARWRAMDRPAWRLLVDAATSS